MWILRKTTDLIYAISKYMLMVLVGSMSLVIIAQVFARTFLGFSIFWSEEYARYCLIWVTFIGASMALKNGELAMFDLFLAKTRKEWQHFYRLGLNMLVLIFVVVSIYFGFKQVFSPTALMQVSPALRIPMWFVNLSVPVGFIIMFIYIVNTIIETLFARNKGE
ncbi:TRAP transporter small permease [Virgibacillus sp. W0430]|uniref:TRAP transporter small permease n=1 Tax=Virgibacillus sp. W0430 TaxID=3391580 RepID=UPI003F46F84B